MPLVCYVARTKPRQEEVAALNVKNQGYEPYLPKLRTDRGGTAVLFPSYLLVLTDGPWVFMRGTRGIHSPVMFGETPAVVPMSEVSRLKSMETDGVVVLSVDHLREGDPVRVRYGVFGGLSGLYAGQTARERVYVLLNILGNSTRVAVPKDSVERDV